MGGLRKSIWWEVAGLGHPWKPRGWCFGTTTPAPIHNQRGTAHLNGSRTASRWHKWASHVCPHPAKSEPRNQFRPDGEFGAAIFAART